jgi:hypothetical protein
MAAFVSFGNAIVAHDKKNNKIFRLYDKDILLQELDRWGRIF